MAGRARFRRFSREARTERGIPCWAARQMHVPSMASRSGHLSHPRRTGVVSMTNPAKKDREPTDAQWEAVRVTDSHMLVSAGAGTGKTFTVVSHILYLMGVEMRGQLHAPPLDLDETRQMIGFRWRTAGGDKAPFDTPAVAEIFRITAGNPRSIVKLCDATLVKAVVDKRKQIDADTVLAAAASAFVLDENT